MLVIANNITTRNARIARVFRGLKARGTARGQPPATVLQELAQRCVDAGADMLEVDIQQYHDHPQAMEFAVKAVQQVTDRPLCLSTNNVEALEAGLRICKRPPLVNYVSLDEGRLQSVLPLIARYGAEVILLIADPTMPGDAQQMLKQAVILVGAVNEIGIPSDSILIDPGLFHITSDAGQRHLVEVMELLRAMPEAFDTPVRSTCWLGNVSAGAPKRLRPTIEVALLAMLSGLGLSSAFLDVLRRENMRMVRLIKVFQNELVYSDGEVEL